MGRRSRKKPRVAGKNFFLGRCEAPLPTLSRSSAKTIQRRVGDTVVSWAVCPGCGRGVRVCRNCKFYSPGSHWDCRETISEPVREKDMVNFCDFFSLDTSSRPEGEHKKNGDRSALDSLFND